MKDSLEALVVCLIGSYLEIDFQSILVKIAILLIGTLSNQRLDLLVIN